VRSASSGVSHQKAPTVPLILRDGADAPPLDEVN
jgi:hypothetical protein